MSAAKRLRGGEIVYHETLSGRHQAGVRCVRCGRVINVEWTADDLADVECRGHGLRLGRCATCYVDEADDVDADATGAEDGVPAVSNTPGEGYIYVTLEPGGRLVAGPSDYDRCADLEVLLTGVASCGCCHVTVVHCGWCAAPVATRHPALEDVDEAVDCGYCNHCDRIITVVPSKRSGRANGVRKDGNRPDGSRPENLRPDSLRPDSLRPDSLRADGVRADGIRPNGARRTHIFVDRVASPDEVADERWAIWRQHTLDEVDDVATWLSMLDEIPQSDLELLEISADQIEFPRRQARLTMEGWLATFGGRGGVAPSEPRDASE